MIKEFLNRGILAGGFGPLVMAIIYGILGMTGVVESLSVGQVCLGIFTVWLMAFVAGGITAIYQVERLPLFSAFAIHGVVLYADYILIYLVNGWLRSQLTPILIFTGVFVAGYALIWCIIYLVIRRSASLLNQKIHS